MRVSSYKQVEAAISNGRSIVLDVDQDPPNSLTHIALEA